MARLRTQRAHIAGILIEAKAVGRASTMLTDCRVAAARSIGCPYVPQREGRCSQDASTNPQAVRVRVLP